MFYILDENKNVKKASHDEYMDWMISLNNAVTYRVDETFFEIDGDPKGMCVSTVFLGFDHGVFQKDEPIVFETLVFGGQMDEFMRRCSTWEDALEMHRETVAMVKATYPHIAS